MRLSYGFGQHLGPTVAHAPATCKAGGAASFCTSASLSAIAGLACPRTPALIPRAKLAQKGWRGVQFRRGGFAFRAWPRGGGGASAEPAKKVAQRLFALPAAASAGFGAA